MVETAKVPKHNILIEHDFSHLDRKLKEKPQIGTIALSGVVCYLNNKTPEFIDSLPAEEKKKMISRAMKEKPERIAMYREQKKNIEENKMKILEERKRKAEKLSENREKRKEDLDKKLEQYGGLWHSKIQMDGCLAALPVEQHKDVLTTQLRYRKQVLGNIPKEHTLLQVQSGKDHFSTEKLKENLELFLTQLQNKGNEGQRKKGTLKRQAE